jgi:hypothetical protein
MILQKQKNTILCVIAKQFTVQRRKYPQKRRPEGPSHHSRLVKIVRGVEVQSARFVQ